MPRASGIKQLLSPSNGLVTEQSKLTPVEGSTTSEDNFDFNDDGSIRRRRKGINKEDSSSFFSLSESVSTTNASSYHFWEGVGGVGGLNYHVFQIDSVLYFFEDVSGNLYGNQKSFNYELNDVIAPAFTDTSDTPVDMSSGEGRLFVVGQKIEPIYIEYDSAGDSISSIKVEIRVRDLTGLDDSLEIDERPAALSEEHDYNLNNQGWWQQRKRLSDGTLVDPIEQFNTDVGDYPSNADISHLGMVDDGSGNLRFKSTFLEELTLGNTPSAKGHFIIDPFNINYESLRTGGDTGGGGYGGGAGTGGGASGPVVEPDPPWWQSPLEDAEN